MLSDTNVQTYFQGSILIMRCNAVYGGLCLRRETNFLSSCALSQEGKMRTPKIQGLKYIYRNFRWSPQ